MFWDRHDRSQSPGQPLKREFWCVVSFPSKGEAGIWSWSPAHSTLSCGEELRWLLAQWSKSPSLFSPSLFSQPESSWELQSVFRFRQDRSQFLGQPPEKSKCWTLSSPFLPSPERSWELGDFLPILWLHAKGRDYGDRVSQNFLPALMGAGFILTWATGASQLISGFLIKGTGTYIVFESVCQSGGRKVQGFLFCHFADIISSPKLILTIFY